MDVVTVVLVGVVAAVSLGGTWLVSRVLGRELGALRAAYEALLKENASLRAKIEAMSSELGSITERVDDIEESLTLLLNNRREKRAAATRKAPPPNIDLKVIALRQRGLTIREIAKQLGISKSTVHRILKRAQLAPA